jgi:hypothetical protein
VVWSQIVHSLAGERERQARAIVRLDQVARGLQTAADEVWRRCQAAETELARLRSEQPGPWVFNGAAALPPDLRVAIFGTGQGGRQALSRLRARGAHVDCFADNDRSRWNQTLDEVPIIDPATLPSRGVGFIAVASVSGRAPIFRQLAQLGYHAGRDFDAVA